MRRTGWRRVWRLLCTSAGSRCRAAAALSGGDPPRSGGPGTQCPLKPVISKLYKLYKMLLFTWKTPVRHIVSDQDKSDEVV